MSYYANGNGVIVFKRKLTNDEVVKAGSILSEAFSDIMSQLSDESYDGKGTFYIDDYDSYHDSDIEKALREITEILPVESGEITYTGDDSIHWRFIYRDGKWIEQSGHVVYDEDDTFGNVSWCRSDIESALYDRNIKPTPELVDGIFNTCKGDRNFTDQMIEAGWISLNVEIDEYISDHADILLKPTFDGLDSVAHELESIVEKGEDHE